MWDNSKLLQWSKLKKAWLLSQRASSVGPYKMGMGGSTTLQRTMPGFSYTRDGFAPKISMPLKRPAKPVRQSRKYMYPTRIYSLRSRDKDEDDDEDGGTSPASGKGKTMKQKKKMAGKIKTKKIYKPGQHQTVSKSPSDVTNCIQPESNTVDCDSETTCKKKRKILESALDMASSTSDGTIPGSVDATVPVSGSNIVNINATHMAGNSNGNANFMVDEACKSHASDNSANSGETSIEKMNDSPTPLTIDTAQEIDDTVRSAPDRRGAYDVIRDLKSSEENPVVHAVDYGGEAVAAPIDNNSMQTKGIVNKQNL